MNSLNIREFQQAIINFTNSSSLPAEVKRLAVKEVLRQLEMSATEEIRAELLAREEKEQAENDPAEKVSGGAEPEPEER